MYHPSEAEEASVGEASVGEASAGERSLEWIEIYNDDPTVAHLSGYFFSNGISFTFPQGVYLEGRSYLVVCADEEAVREKYGITNTTGDFEKKLDNDGETIAINIYGGGVVARVEYGDRGAWPHAADGTGHSLVLKDVHADPERSESWTWSRTPGGTPGAPNFAAPKEAQEVILGEGETWRYLKGRSAYPAGWKTLGFDDSSWERGKTGIGYGDGDDATVLRDMSSDCWSFAARKTIHLTRREIDSFDDLFLQLSYDDGFVFYINGAEVARGASPGDFIAHDTRASLHEASGFETFTIPRSAVRAGENVLACQIHNHALGSSDASFIPRLVSSRTVDPSPEGPPVPVVINEAMFRGEPASGWIELYNASGEAIDLSRFFLSDDRDRLGKWPLPAGSVIPPRGYLVITESESGLELTKEPGGSLSVYLSRPSLDDVVAAELFEDPDVDEPLEGASQARFPDGTGRFFVSTSPTRGEANRVALEDRVVINELMYHPPRGREHLEFLELHNPSGSDVDLSGFRLTEGVDFEFPDGTTLRAGGYLAVAKEPASVASAHGLSGVLGPYEGVLSDSGELVRLVDRLENLVDEVEYFDGGRWSALADGGGSSLELIDPRQDNSVASAWSASDESPKSEWEDVVFQIGYPQQDESELQLRMLAASECLVDDIRVERDGTQYIPNGDFESNTSGWRIEGNHIRSHRTTEDAASGKASLKIVATGDGDTRVNRIETDTSPFMTSGNYTVRFSVRWLRGGNLLYASGYRQPPEFQHTHWMTYPENPGSPGARNSVAASNLGPVISDPVHHPAVPRGGETTTVRVRVSDSDGVASVTARYRLGAPRGAFASATLFDDGLHDDGRAGDGLYAGTIPGQSVGSRVVYYVEARDARGAERTFPREAPGRILVYQHDDPLEANAFTYRLIHDDETWDELNSRHLHSNELLDATFIFEESLVFYNVGTRYRGSPWNRPGNPRMYRVKFGKDNLYRGRSAINLSRYGSSQRERAAYYSVWRNSTATVTCPKSRAAFARVKTNAGTFAMEHIEPVNKDYLELWFPDDDDGILMKITGKQVFDDRGEHRGNLIQWASYQYKGDHKPDYRWNFNLRTRELEDDYGPLMELLRTLNGPDKVLDEELDDIMDVEQWLRVYAARVAHDDWDTIGIGNGQNAYIYFASKEGRWKLIPWDLDHSWGNASARIFPDAESRFARVIQRPKYRRMYLGILHEMLHGRNGRPGHWSSEQIVDNFLSANTKVVGGDGVQGAGGIRSFIEQRLSRLEAAIPARVAFQATTRDGTTVDAATATIEGSGWVDIHDLVVNGDSVELSWPAITRWRAEVPVEPGRNRLELHAFGAGGALVGSDELAITSSFGWSTPSITSVEPVEARPGEWITIRGAEFHEGIEVLFTGTPAEAVELEAERGPHTLRALVPFVASGPHGIRVRNVDGRMSAKASFTTRSIPPRFVRGDANLDQVVDVADPVRVLAHVFEGRPSSCDGAADADADGSLRVADAVYLLEYLFKQGAPPPAPFPEAGEAPEGGAECDNGLLFFR